LIEDEKIGAEYLAYWRVRWRVKFADIDLPMGRGVAVPLASPVAALLL